jgi:hypothetical protein
VLTANRCRAAESHPTRCVRQPALKAPQQGQSGASHAHSTAASRKVLKIGGSTDGRSAFRVGEPVARAESPGISLGSRGSVLAVLFCSVAGALGYQMAAGGCSCWAGRWSGVGGCVLLAGDEASTEPRDPRVLGRGACPTAQIGPIRPIRPIRPIPPPAPLHHPLPPDAPPPQPLTTFYQSLLTDLPRSARPPMPFSGCPGIFLFD